MSKTKRYRSWFYLDRIYFAPIVFGNAFLVLYHWGNRKKQLHLKRDREIYYVHICIFVKNAQLFPSSFYALYAYATLLYYIPNRIARPCQKYFRNCIFCTSPTDNNYLPCQTLLLFPVKSASTYSGVGMWTDGR